MCEVGLHPVCIIVCLSFTGLKLLLILRFWGFGAPRALDRQGAMASC